MEKQLAENIKKAHSKTHIDYGVLEPKGSRGWVPEWQRKGMR